LCWYEPASLLWLLNQTDRSYGLPSKIGRDLKKFRFDMATINCYEIQWNLDFGTSKGNEIGLKDRVVREIEGKI